MARMRTIKPDYWTDSVIVTMTPLARLLLIGSWNFALCDRGHLPDDAMGLKLKVLPLDQVDPTELLEELIDKGRVSRSTDPTGRTWLTIHRFGDHQRADPRWKSRCAACSALGLSTELGQTRVSLGEGVSVSHELDRHHQIGIGGEGEGTRREAPATTPTPPPSLPGVPARNCTRHPEGSDRPCGACKDARLRYEAWEGTLVSVDPDPMFKPVQETECPDHPGYPHPTTIMGCPACDRDAREAA